MSIIEKAYQEFKNRNDKTKIINGKLRYRIVCSDYFNITGREKGVLSVVLSPDMPKKRVLLIKMKTEITLLWENFITFDL